MNEKFNKNAKVELLTKVVLRHGEEKGLIVKDPFLNNCVLSLNEVSCARIWSSCVFHCNSC